MKKYDGEVLLLDRSDINTDEIIPAKYLTEISKKALQPYLLEDLELEGFDPDRDIAGKGVILTRSNFGCGSSREHAPWALEANGIHMVIAESFARIFKQNMFNCGLMAVTLPVEVIDDLFTQFAGKETNVQTELEQSHFLFSASTAQTKCSFSLSAFDRALIDAGGWVEYADEKY